MSHIRSARSSDASRLSEIEIFNYRLNFFPIFQSDAFYFGELQVSKMMEQYRNHPELLENTFVYDDGVVKGFIRMDGREVKKLFVEPVLQGNSIGSNLLEYAIRSFDANSLWALEKNTKAIAFYERHGFVPSGEKIPEDDTEEYLIRMKRT